MAEQKNTSGTSRRAVLGAGAAGMAVLAMPAIARAATPVKIGALLPFTGVAASEGVYHVEAFSMYMDKIGWSAGGRKIELVKADSEFKPPIGLQQVRRLVQQDKVDMFIGPSSSGVAIAIRNYVRQSPVTWVCSGAGLDALTRDLLIPNLYRTSCSAWQTNYPIGQWAPGALGKRAVMMAADFAGGRDTIKEFKQAFIQSGGQVVKEVYPPLGTKDYLPYLSDLKSLKADFAYVFFVGSDSVAFIKQYAQSGLAKTIKLAASGFTLNEPALDATGDAGEGAIGCLHWVGGHNSPVNDAFIADFHKRTGKRPYYAAEYGYTAAQAIAEALKLSDGNTEDRKKFGEALLKVKFEAPRGPFSFDAKTHNVVNRAYIFRVEKRDGMMVNVPIKTFDDIHDPGAV